MTSRSSRPTRPDADSPPETVEEALSRSLRHARRALTEGLLAARSLLDAASLAIAGKPASLAQGETRAATDLRLIVATLARGLDELIEVTRSSDEALPTPVVEAILGALDAEILRWEGRSRSDPDARAVLRAFLGLREILWELGLRGRDARDQNQSRPAEATPKRKSSNPARGGHEGAAPSQAARPRVQRVQIRG
jgi:hypothetical protein